MAKFSPIALTVSIAINEKQLRYVAECVAEYYDNEFGSEACQVAGIVEKELVEDIMVCPQFIKTVTDMTRENGYLFLEEPYDYLDYDFVKDLPGGRQLEDRVVEALELVEDANRTSVDLQEALATVRRAGYKVSN